MTGRGIDQILPYPSRPRIYESAVSDAREYVSLAQEISGKIDYPVPFDYIWGEALIEIEKAKPDLNIVNLETAVTKSDNYFPKGINYRMNPRNVGVLKVLNIDACVLANNHILDWGREGLIETVDILERNGLKPVGAGKNSKEAKNPAIFNLEMGKVIIFAYAYSSSGVPLEWQAKENSAGVNLLANLSEKEITEIRKEIIAVKKKEDFLIFSVHWGANWGYEIDETFVNFTHRLIDSAGVDLVFGHSSHHFKGFEVYRGKLILYGAGDFINDYEGIKGYEKFRGDLNLMYFPEIDLETKNLISLTLVPMQIKKFRLNFPQQKDIDWILDVLRKESKIDRKLVRMGKHKINYGKYS